MLHRISVWIVLVTLYLLPAGFAHAQSPGGGIALNQLDPAPAGDRFFGIPSAYAEGHLVPRAVLLFDYAHRPLVVADGATTGAIVAAQGFLHLGASLALWNRMLISAHFPVAVMQRGDSPTVGGIDFTSPSGLEVGDLRLGARVRLAGQDGGSFQLALGASLHVPTGPANSFVGEGAVRVVPEAAVGGRLGRIVWGAAVRPMFRTSDNPATFNYGVGAALVLPEDYLQIGLELHAATPLQEGFIRLREGKSISRGLTSNAELLLDVRSRIVSGFWIGAAAGPGLTDAIGTPVFRAIGMLGWSPPSMPAETQQPSAQSNEGSPN